MARAAVTPRTLQKVAEESGVTGLAEIKANIAATLTRVSGQQAKFVFMEAALVGLKEIEDLVPVKTGTLKRALFADYGTPTKPNVLLGVNYHIAPHCLLVEYGHGKVGVDGAHAHPYFRPGITSARPGMAAVLAKGLRDVALGLHR